MADTLLTSLRDRVIDEDEPLAGLLRKCLMLGTQTGSQSLREWASFELNGYPDDADLPDYRRIHAGMRFSAVYGYTVMKNQPLAWIDLPEAAREVVPERLSLLAPLVELEGMAAQESAYFGTGPLSVAQAIINNQAGWGRQVTHLAYAVPGPAIAGIVDRIRTTLVELVADLTADTPLDQLPTGDAVEAAMQARVGVHYTAHFTGPTGPVAIGHGAQAHGSVEELIRALADLREMAGAEEESELVGAIDELREAVESDEPSVGAVAEKSSRLRQLAARLGSTTLSSAVSGVSEAATTLAFNGIWG